MASPSTLTFGTLLRQLRRRVGMTQGDLASAVGYSVSFISSLEQNTRQPDVHSIVQHFVPALGLQDEPQLAARLLELAAAMRGDLAPATLTLTHQTRTVLTETVDEPAHALPIPPTLLIGREQEVKLLCNRMLGQGGRLLTLVGPPGIGKTRLGLEVATQLHARYRDGACFVPLAAVGDPEQLPSAILTALGVTDASSKPPQTRLVEFLRRKEILLLLDNFEQITAAGPLVAQLLEACPGLHVLVTSRERLHLRAEQRFPVPPLQVAAALDLFVQRAQAVEPTFELTLANQPVIERICQRLDCLPLAIELIAARIDLFSPQQMLNRLQVHRLDLLTNNAQDAPEHQRTLRRAIQASYALLTERERTLFRTLGVFVDGFDLAAVAHFGFDAEALQGLINKSLVQVAARPVPVPNTEMERRFLLLEMLRAYAYEQLIADQEADAVQRQHATYYMQISEQTEPKLWEAQAANWLTSLETEHNNLRSALTWTLASGDRITALRLSGALGFFWVWHGHVREGKLWLEKALATSADAPPPVWAKALSAAGMMDFNLGNYARALTLVEESLAIYQTIHDQRNVAEKSIQLGGIFRKQQLYAQAQFFYEQGFKLFQQIGDPGRMAAVRSGLGNLAMDRGDYTQARMHYEQGLAGYRVSGNQLLIAEVLPNLARLAFQQGENQRALAYCEELLALAQALGDQDSVVLALDQLSRIMLRQGQIEQATHYHTQSLKLAQELDYPPHTASVLTQHGNLAFAQADFVYAGQSYGESLQINYQLMDRFEIANQLANLASVANALSDAEQVSKLLGAADRLLQASSRPLPASEQPRYQQIKATAQAQLDEATYASAYAAGYAMTLDQAVALALAHFDTPQRN